MTKEIIIDGIDASDCMYYEPKAIKMTCHEQEYLEKYAC